MITLDKVNEVCIDQLTLRGMLEMVAQDAFRPSGRAGVS
jgi:hypothetical protein